MHVFRGILRADCPGCTHLTDDQVIEQRRCLSPLSTVAYLRLALFVRLVQKQNWQLLVILASAYPSKRSWLHTVEGDLAKLARQDDRLAQFRDAKIADWVETVRVRPKKFLKTISEVLSTPEVNRVKFWWPGKGNGGEGAPGEIDLGPPQFAELACPTCSYVCRSPQALSWHQ